MLDRFIERRLNCTLLGVLIVLVLFGNLNIHLNTAVSSQLTTASIESTIVVLNAAPPN